MFNAVVRNQGTILPSRGHLVVWRHFLVITTGCGGGGQRWVLMANGQKPGLLPDTLRCVGQPPPRRPRGILAPNAHSAENEKFLLTEQHCIIWKITFCGSSQKLRMQEEEGSLHLICQVLYTCQGTFDLFDLHDNLTRQLRQWAQLSLYRQDC